MKPATVRDGEAHMGSSFVRNFPVALLFCVGYFVFFSNVWGPLATWKPVAALVVLLGLTLTLRLPGPRSEVREVRRRQQRGGHEAAAHAIWPVWRRIAAILTGVVICFARFRRLRLFRRTRLHVARASYLSKILLLAFGACILAALLYLLKIP